MLIKNYRQTWVTDFQQIKEVITSQLSDVRIVIEHVGSTAIPQLAAKPIIDIDLVYTAREDFKPIKIGLEKLGYYHNGDQGIAGREVFKRDPQQSDHDILDGIKHHLYVCHQDSQELQRHLAFRDYLKKHEDAREAYQDLKYRIAEQAGQNKKTYAKLKEKLARQFVELILTQSDLNKANNTPL